MGSKLSNKATLTKNDNIVPTAFGITADGIKALWKRRYDELNEMSKDELIKLLIGECPDLF